MNNILFEGCAPALVTPFRNGEVDFDALGEIIEHLIKGGIRAMVVLGTTGEAPTLEYEEEDAIVKFAKTKINGRAKMIVGTGSNDTKTAIKRSIDAKNMGADGVMLMTPYYNKATQKGLVAHFTAIADAVKIPVILYNVPGRTGMNMAPETMLELSKNKYMAGVKEASYDVAHINRVYELLSGKMAVYSGNDDLNFLHLAMGATGVISVTGNAFPEKLVELCALVKSGKLAQARALHNKMLEMNTVLFNEVNPIPIKAMMHHLGLCSDEMRAPLTVIEPANREKLISAYKKLK
jgi:4-hydroxy-tetrahydrodipicolinate synthase